MGFRCPHGDRVNSHLFLFSMQRQGLIPRYCSRSGLHTCTTVVHSFRGEPRWPGDHCLRGASPRADHLPPACLLLTRWCSCPLVSVPLLELRLHADAARHLRRRPRRSPSRPEALGTGTSCRPTSTARCVRLLWDVAPGFFKANSSPTLFESACRFYQPALRAPSRQRPLVPGALFRPAFSFRPSLLLPPSPAGRFCLFWDSFLMLSVRAAAPT